MIVPTFVLEEKPTHSKSRPFMELDRYTATNTSRRTLKQVL